MKFKISNILWNPNNEFPFNDITKAYYAAIKLFKMLFILKSNEQANPSSRSEVNKSIQETQSPTNNATETKKHRQIKEDSEDDGFWDSDNEDNDTNPPVDTISVAGSLDSTDLIVHEDTRIFSYTYKDSYVCKEPHCAKGPLLECRSKNCI
eukprot:11607413-Ditylum_brightwellii.AAC.1